MKILVIVDDDYVSNFGDAFDTVIEALDHFEIPASVTVVKEASEDN